MGLWDTGTETLDELGVKPNKSKHGFPIGYSFKKVNLTQPMSQLIWGTMLKQTNKSFPSYCWNSTWVGPLFSHHKEAGHLRTGQLKGLESTKGQRPDTSVVRSPGIGHVRQRYFSQPINSLCVSLSFSKIIMVGREDGTNQNSSEKSEVDFTQSAHQMTGTTGRASEAGTMVTTGTRWHAALLTLSFERESPLGHVKCCRVKSDPVKSKF